ncbi:MAG: ferredoxin [Erysipelotrichaceae bacterium]|nr:ferredoxin [Erysipelotrichaceae bacterium]
MIRSIVEIDKEKCNGCGLCAKACHEGAIEMIFGKATLIKDDYCDGLGDCLPHCPKDAIRIVKREAIDYDHQAVEKHTLSLNRELSMHKESNLIQWPCQIKLMPITASYYDKAHLLIAADCTSFAYANFHKEFMDKRVTLIGCPKLDQIDYSLKLGGIIANNDIRSITLVRMEVPCCKGLELALKKAISGCKKDIHYSIRVISTNGKIVETYC